MLFIHQYPDWTHFRFDQERVFNALANVRFLQGRLSGKASIVKNLGQESVRKNDLAKLFEIDHRTPDSEEFFLAAFRNFSLPLSEKRLFSLHAAVVGNSYSHFRTQSKEPADFLNGFQGVSPEKIPAEISKFIDFCENSSMDFLLKAAIAHFWFVTIRPFSAGNGVLGRIVSDFLISKSEDSSRRLYSLNEEIGQNRDGYFEELSKAQRSNGEISDWILWFLARMEAAILVAEKTLGSEFTSASKQIALEGVSLSKREQDLVNFLRKNGGEISSSKWAELAKISHDTALRSFKNLVEKGILVHSKEKGRSTKYFWNPDR